MDRSISPPKNRAACSTPPWETRQLAQVPYQGSDAARPRPSLRELSTDSGPTRSPEDTRKREHPRSTSRRNDNLDGQRRPSPPNVAPSVPWDNSATMLAGPHTSLGLPSFVNKAPPSPPQSSGSIGRFAGPHTSTNLPSFVTRAPPSPPQTGHEAASRKASVESTQSQDVKAMAGTMTSRSSREQMRHKGRGLSRLRSIDDTHNKENSSGLSGKFKSAMKDLFHRSPIMESNFEKIQGRHWSEEDY